MIRTASFLKKLTILHFYLKKLKINLEACSLIELGFEIKLI